jgi:hypothetical protein
LFKNIKRFIAIPLFPVCMSLRPCPPHMVYEITLVSVRLFPFFYAIRGVSKESKRLVLPRSSYFPSNPLFIVTMYIGIRDGYTN